MNRLDELLKSSVKLSEVVADVTETKTPGVHSPDFEPNKDDFSGHVTRFIEPDEPEIEEEEEDEYDAESNARSLVGGLLGLDTTIFSIIGVVKAKKSVGGKASIDKMKQAYVRKINGGEVTEEDQRLLDAFEVYKNDIAMLEQDYIPNQKRVEMLVKLAIPWCQESKIKVGSGMAFWANYTGYTVERVAKLLMK